ncbi:hypothetical protein [Pedobacter sp.]|uniref:hypothetical protein n=1 Tax=Pedobacter sp. TaxID=1411316 RepID=UPI003D7FD032
MKEKQRGNEKILLGMVSYVLSFTVSEFCKYGYTLAFEKELSDLKGLVKADSIYENDYEILETLNDPAVVLLLNSLNKVAEAIQMFSMINNIDEVENMFDQECHQHASNNFHFYVNESVGTSYESLLMETHELYFSVMHLIFHTAYQLRLDKIDLPEAIFDTFYFDFLDVLDNNMKTDDKNIRLLFELIVDLNDDAVAFSNLT